MEIKSFVKRINTQIRRGKRPVKRKINFEYQGKVYIFTSCIVGKHKVDTLFVLKKMKLILVFTT